MSSTTTTTSTMGDAPSTPSAAKSKPQRRVSVENWDDDFEFSLPTPKRKSSRNTVEATPKRDSLADCSNVPQPHGSPESLMEDWDEPLQSRSRPTSITLAPVATQQHTNRASSSLHPPRTSPSHSLTLPQPIPLPPRQRTEPSALSAASINSFRAAISQDPPIRGVARQSSTYFHPRESAEFSSGSSSPAHNSSPSLASAHVEPRSPAGSSHSPTRASDKSSSHSRRSSPTKAHFSESTEESKDAGRKPKFWSRFSSGPAGNLVSPDRRRMRSSSVGAGNGGRPPSPHFTDPDAPPVPSLPPNHRSSSGGSLLSSSSEVSSTPSAVKESPGKRLSKMMRRSSSNLSATLRASRGNTPSPMPTARQLYLKQNGHTSRTSIDLASPVDGFATFRMGGNTSRRTDGDTPSLRPGLVKSNSEGPSEGLSVPALANGRRQRPLSHQSQRDTTPRHQDPRAGSDTETEEHQVTPGRRTRKHRPPPLVPPSPQFLVENAGDRPQGRMTSSPPASPALKRPFGLGVAGLQAPPGSSNGTLTTSAQTTLNRIASFSKKHGRRLSGGWKFGTATSTSSGESRPDARTALQAHPYPPLEPVEGSPSKPVDPSEPSEGPATNSSGAANRRQRAVSPSTWQFVQAQAPVSANFPEWKTSAEQRRAKKERRRASDFVIPDRVLAAQKGLKRDKVALKEFAEGMQVLQSLMRSHDQVCDYILARGTQNETKLFTDLEREYGEWLEWASLLIEMGSTGTNGHGTGPDIRTRRITLAAGDAHGHAEALRTISGTSVSSNSTFSSLKSGRTSGLFSSSDRPGTLTVDDSTIGQHDLSKRQLEMLQTVLDTPAIEQGTAVTPAARASLPTRHRTASGSPDHVAYHFPSPSYPSPTTASQLAHQQPRRGLSGLRDLWRGFKGKPAADKTTRQRPAPIDTYAAAKYDPHPSPPPSPLPSAGPHDMLAKTYQHTSKSDSKKRRPSVRRLFRHGSGNWADIIRTTPASPLVPNTAHPDSRPDGWNVTPESTPPRPAIPRPPSIPALARLHPKGYPGLGVETTAPPSPTTANHSPPEGVDLPPIPTSSSFSSSGDATLRLKSRVRGLGHPIDGSPSRASSSPARVDDSSKLTVEEVPLRSRSDGAPRVGARLEITPENLPGLLEQAKECERMLGEWRTRAAALGWGIKVGVLDAL